MSRPAPSFSASNSRSTRSSPNSGSGAGRDDFPVAAMWRAVIAGIVFQHASVESLLRELNRNPALPGLCGFNPLPVHRRDGDGRIADTVPNGWNVSRFLKTLVDIEEGQGLVSAIVDDLRAALMAEIPDFGRHLGCDGKAIESHSTGVEGRESGRTSDPDADWGKHETSGVGRDGKLWAKVTSWFGCKLHVIADTRREIPVAVSLTRASASEVKELKRMASGLMGRDPALADRCSEFSADRGLDSGPLKAALRDRWRIRPFIDTRLMWRAERDEPGHDASVPVTRPLDPDRADTMVHRERGELSCVCPETGEQRGMAFEGFERDRETLKCRCPAAAGGFDCAGRAACLKMGGERHVKAPLDGPSRERFMNRRCVLGTWTHIFSIRCLRPQVRQTEGDGFERPHAHLVVLLQGGNQQPLAVPKFERLKFPLDRIDKPEMADILAGIEWPLLVKIELARCRGKHLADPVGSDRAVRGIRVLWHRLPPPPCQIGDHDLAAQMQLGFVDDPPAAWATATELERAGKVISQRRPCISVPHRGSRMRMERSPDDFGDHSGRRVEHIPVGGERRFLQ